MPWSNMVGRREVLGSFVASPLARMAILPSGRARRNWLVAAAGPLLAGCLAEQESVTPPSMGSTASAEARSRKSEHAPVRAAAQDEGASSSMQTLGPIVDHGQPSPTTEDGSDPLRSGDHEPASPSVEDPTGHALDAFYRALMATDHGDVGAMTRVVHWGDSTIGHDGIPHAIRKRMQARFGDGGAGFVLLHQYATNYRNETVRMESNGAWSLCYIAYGCKSDGRYGLGGVTFWSQGGAESTITIRRESELGRVELWYLAQPHGGKIRVQIDRAAPEVIDMQAPQPQDRWHELRVPPKSRRVSVRALRGRVRAYGVVMETAGPGVVWDTLTMTGSFTGKFRLHDRNHLRQQVGHRDPDLAVLTFGGNDLKRMYHGTLTAEQYERELREVIGLVRGDDRELACLVIGVTDHATLGEDGQPQPHPHMTEMVTAQRRAAFAEGCGFFDAYQAMGGAGATLDWRSRKPPLAAADLKHLTAIGRDRMGEMVHQALVAGYAAYLGNAGLRAHDQAAVKR